MSRQVKELRHWMRELDDDDLLAVSDDGRTLTTEDGQLFELGPLADDEKPYDCASCCDGTVTCATCDDCNQRHCQECEPCE